jgi:hypothetical protein
MPNYGFRIKQYYCLQVQILTFAVHIQGVTGGMCHTSGACSLC